MLVVQKSF